MKFLKDTMWVPDLSGPQFCIKIVHIKKLVGHCNFFVCDRKQLQDLYVCYVHERREICDFCKSCFECEKLNKIRKY